MRCLERNKRKIQYALFSGRTVTTDSYGNDTGEPRNTYQTPVLVEVNISEATGKSQTEQFGNLEQYDKVIVTDDMDCPIDENTVLCVDSAASYTQDGSLIYDYVVRRVSKSLNTVAIAIRKVRVGR